MHYIKMMDTLFAIYISNYKIPGTFIIYYLNIFFDHTSVRRCVCTLSLVVLGVSVFVPVLFNQSLGILKLIDLVGLTQSV